MKILAISDKEVGVLYSPMILDRVGNVDMLISCGDLPYYYIEFILSMLNVPCYFVRGNHSSGREATVGGDRRFPWGAVDIHHRNTRDDSGLLLAGLEGCIRYNLGPHQFTQGEYWALVLSMVPRFLLNKALVGRYLDIFVAHAPPWHIHDDNDLPHNGVKAYAWLIKVFQPKYFLHGHIHIYRNDAVTRTLVGKTLVENVYGYKLLDIPAPNRRPGKKERTNERPR